MQGTATKTSPPTWTTLSAKLFRSSSNFGRERLRKRGRPPPRSTRILLLRPKNQARQHFAIPAFLGCRHILSPEFWRRGGENLQSMDAPAGLHAKAPPWIPAT